MTIAEDIITEINHMDEENNEEYVYVSDNFTINDFNDVVNELYLRKNISLKYIEMFHFIILINNENNRFETSTDRKVASNIASLTTAYKKDEFIKASASINRPPEYPFQSLNDIYPNNHQFPYFIKPSEYNVNPNTILTIGRVLGADNIDLPEKVLIENLMKLKEYQELQK